MELKELYEGRISLLEKQLEQLQGRKELLNSSLNEGPDKDASEDEHTTIKAEHDDSSNEQDDAPEMKANNQTLHTDEAKNFTKEEIQTR